MSDETNPAETPAETPVEPRWQPLEAIDRRVAGVLVEKAKTTPSAYPLTLNAVTTGANQKSNRAPAMNLEPDDVEESLDRLREMGAVGLIEGHGRVSKYRHYLYDWLSVDKVEIAVMAELLLRGPQTIGELRGRAGRMEPIRDLAEFEPVLDALELRGLVVSLSRKGRGQVVTHALYPAKELERIKAQHAGQAAAVPSEASHPAAVANHEPPAIDARVAEGLNQAVESLRTELAQVRSDLGDLAEAFGRTEEEVRRLRNELGG